MELLCYCSEFLVSLLYAGPPCQPEASSQVGAATSENRPWCLLTLCIFEVIFVRKAVRISLATLDV